MIELQFSLNTFYFLMSGVLVMFMAAGFTMLEAGLVRAKNTTEILTKNLLLYSVSCLVFLSVGYNIMYLGNPEGGIVPQLGVLFGATEAGASHSQAADFFFQVVFVATAMSIVSGAVAERMKLGAFLLFAVVLTGVIYPVEGYWTWGGGFLSEAGFVDFAGSGIVHMAGAAAALAGVILLGARRGKYGKDGQVNAIPGANLPLATLGTFVLWFGWFGFNGGSQLAITGIENADAVGKIFVNTNMAAAAGAISAYIVSLVLWKKADLTMILNGALAGLVTITADPLSPSYLTTVGIGALGGAVVIASILTLDKFKLDDPVGAISVHGTCGLLGLLLVPLSNPEAALMTQLYGAGVIFAWVFASSFIVWAGLRSFIGIRVSPEVEEQGLDITECGIEAYAEFKT